MRSPEDKLNVDRMEVHPHDIPAPKLRLLITLVMIIFAAALPGAAMAQDDRCPPTSLEDISAWLDEAEELVALVDYASALTVLARVESRLPCVEGAITRSTLTRLYVDRGVTHFYLQSEDVSIQAFSKALSIAPDLTWDDTLGQRPMQLFDRAVEQNAKDTPQSATLPRISEDVTVYVDGEAVSSEMALELLPGVHLLQTQLKTGEWRGLFFTVYPGTSTKLPVPDIALAPDLPPEEVEEPTPPPVVDEPSNEPKASASFPYRYGIYGGTGLAAGGFIAFTIAGTRYWSTRNELLENYDQTVADDVEEAALMGLLNEHRRAARVANVGLGAAVVGAGIAAASVYLQNKDEAAAVSAAPYFVPGQAGLNVSLRF